jgi:acetyl-CoA carboxylase biotin carboxyl carrier protein
MTAFAARLDGSGNGNGSGPADPVDEPRTAALLAAFDHVLRTAPTLPCRLLVQWGELSLDVSWPAPPAVAAPPTAAAAPPASAEDPPSETRLEAEKGTTITAPLVGTFYRGPEPGAPAFVEVGDPVEPGQRIAIIEAMKLMNGITAEQPGRIVDVLVADGDSIEYGQTLFVVEPIEED